VSLAQVEQAGGQSPGLLQTPLQDAAETAVGETIETTTGKAIAATPRVRTNCRRVIPAKAGEHSEPERADCIAAVDPKRATLDPHRPGRQNLLPKRS